MCQRPVSLPLNQLEDNSNPVDEREEPSVQPARNRNNPGDDTEAGASNRDGSFDLDPEIGLYDVLEGLQHHHLRQACKKNFFYSRTL